MKQSPSKPLNIRQAPSPNFDDRTPNIEIDTVLLHATVLNTLADLIAKFSDPNAKVSAHYTIDRDGSLVRHVAEEKRAWHAGASKMKDGRERVNDFSIGIEMVNLNDGLDPYPDMQIFALRELIKMIKTRHNIKYILPHYEVAFPIGRKSDPIGFDFKWLKDII